MSALNAEETLAAKQSFERYAASHGVTVKYYHCDNGQFADKAFISAIQAAQQTITF
jgi:hypothetical protein